MPLADCQIGTPTAETQVVTPDRCAACHLGAANGKFYMHHIDPGFSPTGNWALDNAPVGNCKACHNQDGYAGYVNGDPSGDRNVSRTTDPIVRRVHGVHMGEELALPFNNDPDTGDFKDYIHVAFPADVRNCTSCHVDDRWRNNPSAGACGTCHDNVWFGAVNAMPADYVAHPGGPYPDNECFVCHAAGQLWDTADAHVIPAPTALDNVTRKALDQVDISLTPPANGTHYVAGEAPVVTVVIRDDNGNPIDHTKVTSGNFGAAALMVYGNRAAGVPVLTNTARYGVSKQRASATSASASNWNFVDGDTFKLGINGNAAVEYAAPAGTKTPAQVKTWLEGVLSGVTVTNTSTAVTIKSNIQGPSSLLAIYDSAVTTKMGWKATGTTVDPDIRAASASYPQNDLRALTDVLDYADPAVTRSVGNITYQLDDVDGLAPGTYSVYVWSRPTKDKVANLTQVGSGYVEFQVGTATVETKVATNCTNCHADNIMHIPTPTERGPHPAAFDADQCKACHDYSHYNIGDAFKNQGGTSQNGWAGFGAVPISRRVHGLHFGRYLEHPEEIYSGGNPFAELVFPQDIRNCSACHPAGDTTAAWLEQPNRVACLGCHDSDAAKTHAQLNTYIPDPDDPYGADSAESCAVCHGKNKAYAADVVHALVPYQPPYPRDPE
jgi:predicted CXXCH cytochrome family protein